MSVCVYPSLLIAVSCCSFYFTLTPTGIDISIVDIASRSEQALLTIPLAAIQAGVDTLSTATSSAINKAPIPYAVTSSNAVAAGLAVQANYIFVLLPALRMLAVLDTSPTTFGAPTFYALPGDSAITPQYSALSVLPSPTPSQYYVYLAQPFPVGVQRFTLDLDTGFVPCCLSCGGVFSIGNY